MKPVRWRPLARRDADEAAAWYGEQGGPTLELAFVDALEAAIKTIARHPGIGSSRHAVLLKLQHMRFWPLTGFPYLVFHVQRQTHIDLWRVLHVQRDIPAWIGEET
ncbi:type II toxin-antitoxin system RelE/ParE family toxin [Xanthomonas cerealis pv. cerealis]|uniref:Type II toxin-antitoxin system RelE/ParE family toxin n=1 Tax=Xanthomonas cerealis pv. cerealis TaxID=152263 RepID=A0A514EE51_9XANT|nr:type II toxin-antitoxin system RelE/ParE family toxin [Xanthomonas translucens]QDI04316.1 type II toxin-antitoxin system RelE/ParE family toxin [Xanthomonas translucens pv. cerealis]UKE68630.1 type II toxin-antitoxin system RelE/ParE family toxin [Xanthomonas translucens pv. pistacia]